MLEKIIEYISDYQGISKDKLSKDTKLIQDLDMSSIDMMQMCAEVEEEYGIEMPIAEIYEVETIGDVALLVEKYINIK
ncbi:acyl carrier protein [Clostridium felsineum]|uniref:acyl carrier protein n=1 Tax=Clostridium felsineum TaxID=36839 RepID=UPI00098CD0D0|nr:acyl carrier protein [Clostridium felsineum]URZ01277.1 Acyl carrier protein [Clostridium felsineum]